MNSTGQPPARILYVDAHPEMRRLMLALLEYAGHGCADAGGLAEAVDRVATAADAFDLVIVAHKLPELDGLALAQQLRAAGFAGRILFYSMALDSSDEAECRKRGVDAVLRNPTPGDIFLQRVTALCRRQT